MRFKTKEQTQGSLDGNSHYHQANVAQGAAGATVNENQLHWTAGAKP